MIIQELVTHRTIAHSSQHDNFLKDFDVAVQRASPLQYARLHRLSLEEVRGSNWRMENSHIKESNLQASKLQNCWFTNSKLFKTIFCKSRFLNSGFENSRLLDCNLKEIVSANLRANKTNFINCNFHECRTPRSTLTECVFLKCNFGSADFSKSQIENCIFMDMDLQHLNFTNATFVNCWFSNCHFSRHFQNSFATSQNHVINTGQFNKQHSLNDPMDNIYAKDLLDLPLTDRQKNMMQMYRKIDGLRQQDHRSLIADHEQNLKNFVKIAPDFDRSLPLQASINKVNIQIAAQEALRMLQQIQQLQQSSYVPSPAVQNDQQDDLD